MDGRKKEWTGGWMDGRKDGSIIEERKDEWIEEG